MDDSGAVPDQTSVSTTQSLADANPVATPTVVDEQSSTICELSTLYSKSVGELEQLPCQKYYSKLENRLLLNIFRLYPFIFPLLTKVEILSKRGGMLCLRVTYRQSICKYVRGHVHVGRHHVCSWTQSENVNVRH